MVRLSFPANALQACHDQPQFSPLALRYYFSPGESVKAVFYITTLGRVRDQPTFCALPPDVLRRTKLVVQHHERELYSHYGVPVVVLPPAIKRLSPTREWLAHHTDEEKMFLLDDDMTFYRRKSSTDWHLVKSTPADMSRMFGTLEEWLGTFAHVAVSPREGNNRVEAAISYCTRAMRLVGYRTGPYAALEPLSRLHAMSDFDATLQLLRRGYANKVSYHYAQNHGSSNAPGGCSVYRTKDLLAESARKLAALHPEFVRLVEKETKGSWGGGTRIDVQVQWKKAYQSGLPETLK